MKKLVFKKLGWFLEELSARYSAQFSEHTIVEIFKCADRKTWIPYFKTNDGHGLISFSRDYISCLPNLTKKELIETLEDYLNSDEAGDVETAAINWMNFMNTTLNTNK